MRNLKQIILVNALLVILLSGCAKDEKLMDVKEDLKGLTLNLTIPQIETGISRAVLPDAGESTLNNVYILFYAPGDNMPTLFYSEQIKAEDSWSHSFGVQSISKLKDGITYDVYVLANLSEDGSGVKVPTNSMSRYNLLNLNDSRCYCEDESDISFSGSGTFTKTPQIGVTENGTLTIALQRLMARIDIDLSGNTQMEGYSVESVWIENAPAYSPFFVGGKRKVGRAVISEGNMIGDFVRFYSLENAASTLAEEQLTVGILLCDASGNIKVFRSQIEDAIERNKIYQIQIELDLTTTRIGRMVLKPLW